MSMKVYDAYRIAPKVKIFDLVGRIREQAVANIKATLEGRYRAWVEADKRPEIVHSPEFLARNAELVELFKEGKDYWSKVHAFTRDFKHEFDRDKDAANVIRAHMELKPDAPLTYFDCGRYVEKQYREQLGKFERNDFNLDVAVYIFPYEGRFYLRTDCDHASIFRKVLDFVPDMPELEDYHYQNSTDRPREVSSKDWRRRYRIWDALLGRGWGGAEWNQHITVDIMRPNMFHSYDPSWRMQMKERKNDES